MVRKIIKIEEAACNGCGICAAACHEGAIEMREGKARLVREDFCDGLGDCLPGCPTGAISFEVREAPEYNAAAVAQAKAPTVPAPLPCGCPGSQPRTIGGKEGMSSAFPAQGESCLGQWPVQIKLVPVRAPYFSDAHLLIAADCTAYAYGNFHLEFMKNRITLIGCPKLDEGDYREKLTQILLANGIKSLTVARMEVPCCGGMERAAKAALLDSGKDLPWRVVTFSGDGRILEEQNR